jgi:hypothetical protein
LPRLSLWKDGTHSADYKFQDNRIRELFTAGGTGFNLHKYLGPNEQDNTGDVTQPSYVNPTEQSIQDLLFLENRDRKYAKDIYNLRGHYAIMDTDFNLSQFGLFVTNDTLFLTFHINDMIERMGRKIMPGDVLEFHHLRDFNPLDPNDEIPIALRKYYVVQETNRAAEGFAPTWWPHLWRVKVQPMVDGQEYRDILNQQITDEDGNEITGTGIRDYLSTYDKNVNINDAILTQAEIDVPYSGYDTDPLYVLPTNDDGTPALNKSENADTTVISTDSTVLRADHTYVTPKRDYLGYLVGDMKAPNGLPVKSLTYFPENAQQGDYVLRLDFFPNRLFRFDGIKWVVVEDAQRAVIDTTDNNTQWGTFWNNSRKTTTQRGEVIDEKVALSKVLRITPDN